MQSLIKFIAQQKKDTKGVALVIGAGSGNNLSALREANFGQLLMIEPHPRHVESLAEKLSFDSGETYQSLAVISEEDEYATLNIMLNSRFNSLLRPVGLFTHMPNLRQLGTLQVPAKSLNRIIEEQTLSALDENALIINAPGQGYALLASCSIELLSKFNWIIVRDGNEPLYENEYSLQDVQTLLTESGFDYLQQDEDEIYPFGIFLFQRNQEKIEEKQLKQQMDMVITEYQFQVKLNAEQALQLQQWQEEQRELVAQLQSKELLLQSQEAAYQQLQQEKNSINKQLNNALQQVTIEKDEAEEVIKQAKEYAQAAKIQLTNLQEKLILTEQKNTDLQNNITKLQEEIKQQQASHEEECKRLQVNQTAHELKKALDSGHKAEQMAAQKEQELKEAQQRIQQLQIELTDTQFRQELLQEEVIKAEGQVELIKDLLLREPSL